MFDKSSSTHGEFGGRLSSGHSTTELEGYSMWHLVAAKLIAREHLISFLECSSQVPADTLLDDLREGMSIFPDYLCAEYSAHTPYQGAGMSWKKVRDLTAFKTPLEICQVIGYPLIFVDEPLGVELHAVVQAAQIESARLIRWPIDELLT